MCLEFLWRKQHDDDGPTHSHHPKTPRAGYGSPKNSVEDKNYNYPAKNDHPTRPWGSAVDSTETLKGAYNNQYVDRDTKPLEPFNGTARDEPPSKPHRVPHNDAMAFNGGKIAKDVHPKHSSMVFSEEVPKEVHTRSHVTGNNSVLAIPGVDDSGRRNRHADMHKDNKEDGEEEEEEVRKIAQNNH